MARRQKQLNPIVTVGNKITKAVCCDKAEFRTGKTPNLKVPSLLQLHGYFYLFTSIGETLYIIN